MALAYLVGAFLVGVGLTRRVYGRLLSHAEQALYGLPVGWMLSALAAYGCARALGHLSARAMFALTAAVWVAALLLWLPEGRRLRGARASVPAWRELGPRIWRGEYAGLLLVLALFAPVYLRLFPRRMLHVGPEGIYSGGSAWHDIAWHAAITSSFLYGENFPPVNPALPPEPLLYPYLPDFHTATLAALGLDIQSALATTGVVLSLCITGLAYMLAWRMLSSRWLTDARASVAAATLATILFLLNGGLGFLYFLEDWRKSGRGFFEFLAQIPAHYIHMPAHNIQWSNIIAWSLVPQPPSLYGVSCALMVFSIFAAAWQRWDEGAGGADVWDGWRLLLPAGVLTGLLPVFHTHSYIAVGLVSGFLFILRPRRAWLAFWAPALLIAAPQLVRLAGHAAGDDVIQFWLGWRSAKEVNPLLYWVRNIGVPLLLVAPAWWQSPRTWRKFYLAFALMMLTAQVVIFSPNGYDNIKLMHLWYGLTCVYVAAWLTNLARVHRQPFLAFLLALASVASALLALRREGVELQLLFTREEVEAASFVREHTAPRSLFLTGMKLNHPVFSLAGRAVLRGNTALLWSHGYEIKSRYPDIKAIYHGDPGALELLGRYGVEYVYVGPTERETYKADQDFFERNFPALYRSPSVTVYDTRGALHTGANTSGGNARRVPRETGPQEEFSARLAHDPYQFVVEFPRAAFAVYRYHRLAFDRAPRYEEMRSDLESVGRGVYVGAGGWEKAMEENKSALTDGLVARPEFKAVNGALTDEQYVDALYARAGVAPTAEIRRGLVEGLGGGRETRASLLRRVAEERQFTRREYNTAFLLMHYFGYLQRNPEDPPDNNLDGFNFWLNQLNANADYNGLTGLFIDSTEYNQLRSR